MSLGGNVYFGGQNLENTQPLNNLNLNIESLKSDIIQNTTDIDTNTTAITSNTTAIETNTTDITTNANNITTNANNITSNTTSINAHTTLINANTTALTGITYDNTSSKDLTTVDNHLLIKALNGWGWNQKGAHLVIQNSSLETANQYSIAMYAGTEYGIHLRSLIANEEGACCIVNTRNDMIEDSSSIILCGMHKDVKKGMKISLNNGYSEYYGNTFIFYSRLYIQPPGSSTMDVYTRFSELSQNYDDMLVVVDQNTSDITAIEGVNTTQDSRLTSLESATVFQSSQITLNRTVFNSTVHAEDFFAPDVTYGNCSMLRNRLRIANIETLDTVQDIRLDDIETLNTAHDVRLDNIETLNTTQTNDISSNASAIASLHLDMLDNRGDIDINHADIVNNANDIIDIQSLNTTQDTRLESLEAKTNFQTSNGTSETRFTSHVHGVNFYSWDSRYNGGSTSIISNYQEILLLQTENAEQDIRLTNIETVNTTQTNDITAIETLNTTQDNRLDDVEFLNTAQNTRLTSLEMAPSSKYTGGRGSFNTTGMTIPNAINVWDTLNMDTLPTAYVGGSPNAPAGRNGIRLTTAGVYKIIFSFSYASVSSNGSDWNLTHRMRLNTVDSTTYTPIIASRIFDIRGSGDCCSGSHYTSMNSDNLILYANNANDWIMQYRTRTDSAGNTRPNRFNLCVSFSHSGVTSDYFLQTYSSETRSLVDCRYILTYEAY
jgi:hypothetical protein